MDRDELAAMLTAHPPHATTRRSLRNSSRTKALPRSGSKTIVPQQQQERPAQETKVGNGDVRRHRRNKSISLNYNPYDAPQATSSQAPARPSPQPAHASAGPWQTVVEEPDFVTEEREAWSRKSPDITVRRSSQLVKRSTPQFILYEDTDSEIDIDDANLPAFRPLPSGQRNNVRPKTSRGPELEGDSLHDGEASSTRPSKFLEGSMSSRSAAVAATWSEHSSDYETGTSDADDSDATPKATRSRHSSSSDLRDFDPPPASATTIKRTLFRRKRRSNLNTEDIDEQHKQKPGKERKRLRKSLSNWNLHALGEKIGIFNNSTTSIDEVGPALPATQTSVLDERKRKAEIAYSKQCQPKKRKSDNGPSAYDTYQSEPDRYATIKRKQPLLGGVARSEDEDHEHPNTSLGADISCRTTLSNHDARKRPSRRELEKENQKLRDLLRESQCTTSNTGTVTRRRSMGHANAWMQPPPDNSAHTTQSGMQADDRNPGDTVPVLTKSSQRMPSDLIDNTVAIGLETTPKITSDGLAFHPILQPTPLRQSSRAGSISARRSLPALPRSINTILEDTEGEIASEVESEAEAEKVSAWVTTSSVTDVSKMPHGSSTRRPNKQSGNGKFVIKSHNLRRRGRPDDKPEDPNADKENTCLTTEALAVNGKQDWSGWDDDVF